MNVPAFIKVMNVQAIIRRVKPIISPEVAEALLAYEVVKIVCNLNMRRLINEGDCWNITADADIFLSLVVKKVVDTKNLETLR